MLHCWKWQISKKFPCNFNYEAPDPSCMVNGEIRQTFTLYSNLEVLEENSSPSSWFPGGWKMSKTYHTWMILVKTWSRERFPRKSQSGKEEMMFPFFLLDKDRSFWLLWLRVIQPGLYSIFLSWTAPTDYKGSLLDPSLLCREKVEIDDGEKVL